jgi:hypothetical protein
MSQSLHHKLQCRAIFCNDLRADEGGAALTSACLIDMRQIIGKGLRRVT